MKKGYMIGGLVLLVVCIFGFLTLGSNKSVSNTAKAVASDGASVIVGEKILVSKNDISAGEFLENRDFHWVSIETSGDKDNYYLQSGDEIESIEGAILNASIAKGEPILKDNVILKTDSAFFAAVLGEGKRAFAISVDAVSGGAGLIRPGNTVDVILIPEEKRVGGNVIGGDTAQTILTNIPVIAVNRDYSNTGVVANPEGSNDDEGTVTLEVAPKQAELLAVGQASGTLYLSLVNIHDAKYASTGSSNQVTRASEILGEVQKDTPVKTLYGEQKKN